MVLRLHETNRLLAGEVLEIVLVVVLFQCRKTGTAVILRAATALLVPKVLSGVWSKEAFERD